MPTRLLLALLLGALWAAPALAQNTPDDEASAQPALPDIAPREVEIRGRLDVSLPSLERPALTGLLHEMRLAPLPPLAPPPVEAPAPPEGAPQSLADDAEGAPSFSALPPGSRGLLEAGGGRYFSRFAQGRLNLPLGQTWALHTRFDYAGLDGFEPFDESDVQTPSDRIDGALTLRTEREQLSAALALDGFFAQRTLYGTTFDGSAASVNAQPGRDFYGAAATLDLETGGSVPLDARARYDATQVETEVFEDDPFDRSEQRFSARLGTSFPAGATTAEASARFATASLGGSDAFDGSATFLDAGGGAWLLDEARLRVFAGARVLTFDAAEAGGTYAAPDVRLAWTAAPRLTLYARTRPAVEAHPLADLHRENPSLLDAGVPRPTLRTVDAEGGLRFFAGYFELNAFGGYQYAPHLLFFEDAPASGAFGFYTRGTTAARYGSARILRGGGSVSLRRTGRLHASLSATFRDGTLTGGDTAIPYFSPLVAEALLAYDFGRGHVQLTGAVESARYLDRSETDEVGAFADVDLEGTYALTPSLGLVVRLENLPAGALERYDRYPRASVIVGSGLRVRF